MNSNNLSSFQPIIGLEVHVELATKSKMFCGCPADHFGKKPNTQTCPVCLGLPGALPVPNKKAVEWTIMLALALNCKINRDSYFDRKNYFYPDLPKGYQISQHFAPFGVNGHLGKIRICDVHLEEDTGKLQHDKDSTLVDFNRSGVPLVEIVTEPDFRSLEQVDVYLKKLQQIIRYLEISNADMEKGSMRLEPSISLSYDGKIPNYRVELKNINSFKFVKKALAYEIERQQKEPHIMETRGWDENKNITVPQRSKEEAHDYRYFPEPDIPPIDTSIFKPKLPELPDEKINRFIKNYNLSIYQANLLCDNRKMADAFEELAKKVNPKDAANSLINKRPLVSKSTVPVDEKIIQQVLDANPKAVEDYKKGKIQVLGFLIGQVSKLFPDSDKNLIKDKLEEKLNE